MGPREIAESTIKSVMKQGETSPKDLCIKSIMYDLNDRRMLRGIDKECIEEIQATILEIINITLS